MSYSYYRQIPNLINKLKAKKSSISNPYSNSNYPSPHINIPYYLQLIIQAWDPVWIMSWIYWVWISLMRVRRGLCETPQKHKAPLGQIYGSLKLYHVNSTLLLSAFIPHIPFLHLTPPKMAFSQKKGLPSK